MLLAQLALNGLALGAAYALVALGFVLILNATGAVNFAHGDLVVAGGYMAVALAGLLPVPGLWLLPLVFAGMAGLGIVVGLLAYFPLKDRPPVSVFISTIALAIILQNLNNALFGAAPRAGPPLLAGPEFALGALVIGRQALAVLVAAAVIVGALHLLLFRTQLGRKLRATAQDRVMAAAVGVPVNAMIALSFALAAALAGTAGMLLANQFFVTPAEGTNLMLKAYIAATIGGWGRLHGAVLGALLIALFEVIVAAWASYPVAEAMLYLTVLAILFVRPQGLFGEPAQRRA